MVNQEEAVFYDDQISKANMMNSLMSTGNIIEQQAAQNQDVGMFKEQLGLEDVYDLIDHLLEGEVLTRGPDGVRKWQKPLDETMLLLSEEGINYVRRRLSWHLNKNTLLSNYGDDMILDLVKDFSFSLQDALFMKSRQFFRQPSIEQCYKVLKQRIEKKAQIKDYAYQMLGIKKEKEVITKELIKELERGIEKEIEIIRGQLIKNREKEFESLIIDIEYLLLSTYNRALKGEERGSIRRHQQALEFKGGGMLPDGTSGMPKPSAVSSLFKK